MTETKRQDKPWLFKPGNPGGPGRPKRETEREYLDAIVGQTTMPSWVRIIQKAIDDAEAGDRYARDWLSKYLLPQSVDGLAAAMAAHGMASIVFRQRGEATPEPEPDEGT